MEPIIGTQEPPVGDLITDGDTEGFADTVLAVSRETPVIVDFWAPWCGPCKQLGPALEKAVRGAGGKVRLVKINVDENQELAAQFRIQSIPAVYAFKDGQPVDGFMGALEESQIKEFIGRLIGDQGPSPIDLALEQAKEAQATGDHATASSIFQQILQHEPETPEAFGGLVKSLIATEDTASARQVLDQVPETLSDHAEIASARAALELAEGAQQGDSADFSDLRTRLEANQNDHEARFELAMALYGAGEKDQAADELIEIIKRERSWNDEAARKQLVKFFEAAGHTDPFTIEARAKLSAVLFA